MSYPEMAMALLKARGYRQTRPRKLVLEALAAAETPLSPYELAESLRGQGEKGDVVSMYRILQTLEENDLVHRVLSTGKYRRCQLAPEHDCHRPQMQHCHHNLLCRRCGAIEEVHCPGMELIEQVIASQSQFAIEAHRLEFSGLCGACQQAGAFPSRPSTHRFHRHDD
ncbi:MAG: Fur family transcriptional regulator [Candidatus Sericytochromatia bacterium]|nr:Fur family transcriptional regulator [Candidatus Sericytochromatia bacterium]